MKTLKTCPFCGCKPEIWVDNSVYTLTGEEENDTNFQVSCWCGVRTKWYTTRSEAIKTWNRRAYEQTDRG